MLLVKLYFLECWCVVSGVYNVEHMFWCSLNRNAVSVHIAINVAMDINDCICLQTDLALDNLRWHLPPDAPL